MCFANLFNCSSTYCFCRDGFTFLICLAGVNKLNYLFDHFKNINRSTELIVSFLLVNVSCLFISFGTYFLQFFQNVES